VDFDPPSNGAVVPRSLCGAPPSIELMSTQLSQVEKVVGDLQKSFDQLRSEVGAATTILSPRTASSSTDAPSGSWVREVSSIQLHAAAAASSDSICESQFEMESAKMEQNAVTLHELATKNTWLSQCMAEVREDVAKMQKMGITYESEVSELRSRLEVVVRECDEHIYQEQNRRAEESAAYMLVKSSEEKDLSDRVQSMENACQQAMTMPSVMFKASESLRAELRLVVDPLRENLDCLKQAMDAMRQRHEKEFRDLAESKVPAWCSNPHNVVSLHRRLADLEAAYKADSKKLMEFEQSPSTVEQGRSEEMQKAWAVVNSQVSSVTQSVEFLQKQYTVFQERISNLENVVAHASPRGLVAKGVEISVQQQQQQQQGRDCQQQHERCQAPYSESSSMRGNRRINNYAVQAAMTRNMGSSTNIAVRRPVRLASGILNPGSANRTPSTPSFHGAAYSASAPSRPSFQGTAYSSSSAVIPADSGQPAAPKVVSRAQSPLRNSLQAAPTRSLTPTIPRGSLGASESGTLAARQR